MIGRNSKRRQGYRLEGWVEGGRIKWDVYRLDGKGQYLQIKMAKVEEDNTERGKRKRVAEWKGFEMAGAAWRVCTVQIIK